MSLKKTVAVVAAAGALAAISVPAMAFENEFHGMYKFRYTVSDFEFGNTAANSQRNPAATPTATSLGGLAHETHPMTYLEQRARVQYIAKASDDLKLVTHFELDARFGGYNGAKYGPVGTSTDGGSLDADGISLETKHVYLDFNVKPTNVKVGIQPYKDAFKGVFLDADVAAVNTTTKVGAATVGLAFSRVYDGQGLSIAPSNTPNATQTGTRNTDVVLLDTKFDMSKDASVGLSYYLLASNLQNNAAPIATVDGTLLLHTFGLTADVKSGPVSFSGFAATQVGHKNGAVAPVANDVAGVGKNGSQTTHFRGYALNAAAKVATGGGAFRVAALYTSGDKGGGDGKSRNNDYTGWMPVKTVAGTGGSGSSVTSYNEGGMMLMMRNTAQNNTNSDVYMAGTTDNSGKGITLATLGYDAKIDAKTYANTNLGFGWSNERNVAGKAIPQTGGLTNGTNFMGAEINTEIGYKVFDNLTAAVQGAYVFLGGAYRGLAVDSTKAACLRNPENPYTGRIILSYAF